MVDTYEFASPSHQHIVKLKDGTKLRFTPEWVEIKRGGRMVRQRNGSSYLAETKDVFDQLWAAGYRAKPKATGGKKPKWTGDSADAPSPSED